MNGDRAINIRYRFDYRTLQQGSRNAAREIRELGKEGKRQAEDMDAKFKKLGTTIAAAFAVSKIKDFAVHIAKVRGEFQQLEVAFETMLGNKQQADALMNQLIKTAATTPFGMSDIANSAKQLLAYGTAADQVNETLIRLGDIAAGLSIPINDLAYLYGTTMVQGRLYTQDFNQFLNRGIPITKELAKQFGIAESKVKSYVEEGKVGFPEIEKCIISMTSEGGKFAGLMEAQSKTISGQISNIEDSIEQMFNEVGRSQEGLIADVLGATSTIIDNWQKIGKAVLVVVSAYGAYKAALLAVYALSKLRTIWGTVSAFISLTKEVHSAKDAMLLFNTATKANPLGLILGLLASAAAYFSLFSNKTGAAAAMTEKYGENAATAILRVNELTSTLAGLTEGTELYKKMVGDLNQVLEEYGIQQIKEGENIDSINKKRERAIELIKLEAAERQWANNIEQGIENYKTALNDAQANLKSNLESTWVGDLLGLTDKHKELKENSAAVSAIVGDVVARRISLITNKTTEEYREGLKEIYDEIGDRLRKSGVLSEKTIQEEFSFETIGTKKRDLEVQSYINTVQKAAEEHDRYRTAVDKSAKAEIDAAEAATTFEERMTSTKAQLGGASADVHTLYRNIQSLMSKYSDNTIGFHITFDGEIPGWMKKMDIPELKRLAEKFASIGNSLAPGQTANVSGVKYTKQEALQRGADYARAAEMKQEAADKKQRELDATEKERKREAERQRTEREREAKRLADEKADRKKAIDEYYREIAQQEIDAELEIAQLRIDAMDEGTEKELAQIRHNYQRLKAENEDREREMLVDAAKNKLNEWLNLNPKATKEQQTEYYIGLLDPESKTRLTRKDLTSGQQAVLQAYDDLAKSYMTRGKKQMEKTNREAMDEYLKEYGSLQERIDAINRIYQRKAEEAGSQGERMAITQEWNNALNEVNFDDFMTNRAALAFGEVDNLSKETIDALIVELENYRSKVIASFDPEKIREFEEALGKLRKASALGTNNPLGNLFTPEFMRERRAAQEEINEAETAHNKLLEQKANLQGQVQQKTTTLLALIKQHTGKEITAEQAADGTTVQAIINALRDQAIQSKADGNEEEANRYTAMANAIQGASNELVDLQVNLNQTAQASDQAKTYFDQLTEAFKTKFTGQNGALGSILGMVNLVNDAIQGVNQAFSDIKNTAELLGADTSEGSGWDKAQNIMDALVGWSDGVQQIVQSALSGNIAGIIGGIPKIFTSLIGAFAKMHDAANERRIKALQKEVDELDRQNKRLDRQLKDQYSKEARDTNQEKIKAAQQQINLLRQQIAEEEDKKKTDSDRIQEWRDKIESLQNDIEDYKAAALDAVIGEDISSSIDNFADALVGAWGKAGEQARNIKDLVKTMLKQMVIEAMKTDLTAPIANFREMMAKALEDNVVTTAEQQALEDYAKDIAKYIDQRYDWASGIFKENGGGQSGGERGGFATASQDSVEELSGRAAAIHTTLEMSRQMLIGMSTDINSFRKELEAQREIASETRNLQLIAVGHLEDIARNTRELYQINERLHKIEINTRGL